MYFRVSLEENSALTEDAPQDSILPLIEIINLALDSNLVFYGDMGYSGPCDSADRRAISPSPFVLKVDFSFDYEQKILKSSITDISLDQSDGRLRASLPRAPEAGEYKVRTLEGSSAAMPTSINGCFWHTAPTTPMSACATTVSTASASSKSSI